MQLFLIVTISKSYRKTFGSSTKIEIAQSSPYPIATPLPWRSSNQFARNLRIGNASMHPLEKILLNEKASSLKASILWEWAYSGRTWVVWVENKDKHLGINCYMEMKTQQGCLLLRAKENSRSYTTQQYRIRRLFRSVGSRKDWCYCTFKPTAESISQCQCSSGPSPQSTKSSLNCCSNVPAIFEHVCWRLNSTATALERTMGPRMPWGSPRKADGRNILFSAALLFGSRNSVRLYCHVRVRNLWYRSGCARRCYRHVLLWLDLYRRRFVSWKSRVIGFGHAELDIGDADTAEIARLYREHIPVL